MMNDKDLSYARSHLKVWCRNEGMSAAEESKLWRAFRTEAAEYTELADYQSSWPELRNRVENDTRRKP